MDENTIAGLMPEPIAPVSNEMEAEVALPPDPYQDHELIRKHIDRLLNIDKNQRMHFEREWFRNILFYVGQQWIIYEKGQWRAKKMPKWFPRAQTNRFAEKANDITSALLQNPVPIQAVPATDNADDVATANIGERLIEVMMEEFELENWEEEAAKWLVLTGNVFLIPYYDSDAKYGQKTIPNMECMDCGAASPPQEIEQSGGVCPQCGGSNLQEAVDVLSGEPVGEKINLGSLCVDVCAPFEIRLDHRIRSLKEQRAFARMRVYDVEFAREHWVDHKEEILPDKENLQSQYYLDALAQVTGTYGTTATFSASGSGSKNEGQVTACEFYELPTEEFPEGLRAVRLGATLIVEAGPLPYQYKVGAQKGQKFLNIVHIGLDVVPGRFWRKTRMDDLIFPQTWRNIIESNLKLETQRMAGGAWLLPSGCGVETLIGESGLRINYNPQSVGGTSFAKPERLPPELTGVQPLIMLMNQIDEGMERVAGTFFLQGGDVPPGVTAASALAYLGERAQKAMSPLMREWARGFKRLYMMGLEIWRSNISEGDERIRVIAGQNSKWKIDKFNEADLKGAVNLKIDYEALQPKSQATQRATVFQLLQGKIINPADPQQTRKVLELFGLSHLQGSIDLDVQEAVREWDMFLNGDIDPQVIPMVQNSPLHRQYHADAAKTEEFRELPIEKQQRWLAHIQLTVQDELMQQQLMQPAAEAGMEEVGEEEMEPAGDVAASASSQEPKKPPTGQPS